MSINCSYSISSYDEKTGKTIFKTIHPLDESLDSIKTRFEELIHLLVSFWTDRSNLYRKILWCYYLSVIKYICK